MSASPAPQANSQWREYKNSEGRIYWSHAITKQSVWEKPDELKTPFERAMAKTPWKQYTSKGKPYYVNSSTKETVWELPPDLIQLQQNVEAKELARREREHKKAMGQATPTPPPSSRGSSIEPESESENEPSMALVRGHRYMGGSPIKPTETITIPPGGFSTVEKAEEAFIHLLKREGIDEKWTWDQTMRKVVLDPLFKALDTLAQKQAAFEKHVETLQREKREAKEARMAELRPKFRKLFRQGGVIKSFSTLKTADKAFAHDKYWRRAKPEERQQILEEYTGELKKHEEAARKQTKEHNINELTKLIKTLDLTVTTRWRAARDLIEKSEPFRADPRLAKMEQIDMLGVYDDYMRVLEKEHDEESRRLRAESRRKARKARDGFKALLRELRENGQLTRTSKWKDTIPLIKDDERYLALLGPPGSSPLDLWMDAVDDLQIEADGAADKIASQLSTPVTAETSWEEFDAACMSAGVTADEAGRKEAFEVLQARLARAAAEEQRRQERKRRHRMDDLRDALRKVRTIDADMSYDAALPHMQDLPEFKDVDVDEDRRAAFEKHTRRLKEKARDSPRSRDGRDHRERDRGIDRDRERDRYRDRSRGDRMDVDDRRRDRSKDRDWRDRRDRDRDYRDRDRERERDRDRARYDNRDRDRDRERRRREPEDDREAKRRRVSPAPSARSAQDKEEGEI